MKQIARLAILIAALAGAAMAAGQTYVHGQVLVKFRLGLSRSMRSLVRVQGMVLRSLPAIGVDQIALPPQISVGSALATLRADPNVEYAEPNYVVRIHDADDPLYRQQWALKKIGAPAAWAITQGSPDVLVAVLDTGADLSHPDLQGQIVASENFVAPGPATDRNGHGTHTAGIVAALTDNDFDVASLGYHTHLLIGKVVGDDGQGNLMTVAEGVAWAVSSGAKVISMSLGVTTYSQTMRDAVDSAWDQGVVLVASAGNNSTNLPVYPAAYDHCIAVAATDQADRRCKFSNFGSWVHISAPGQNILSLYKGGGYASLSGTSMAAPQVAALAALLWANGGRANWSIRIAILNSGDPSTGFTNWPAPRINAHRALLRFP